MSPFPLVLVKPLHSPPHEQQVDRQHDEGRVLAYPMKGLARRSIFLDHGNDKDCEEVGDKGIVNEDIIDEVP